MNQLNKEQQNELGRQLQRAEEDPDVPKLYFNGFVSASGASDILVMLKRGETPVAWLNMSYETAKTLGERLVKMVGDFETKTNNNILTIDEVNQRLEKK